MDQIVLDLFGDDGFLFVANNDRKSTVLDGLPNAARIPVLSHGSKEYRNYTSIYYSAATNRNPKHLRMLQNLGFSRLLDELSGWIRCFWVVGFLLNPVGRAFPVDVTGGGQGRAL